jgi:hypothetical protein
MPPTAVLLGMLSSRLCWFVPSFGTTSLLAEALLLVGLLLMLLDEEATASTWPAEARLAATSALQKPQPAATAAVHAEEICAL